MTCKIEKKINTAFLPIQESSCETVIQRDIARTFPAHDFFKEAGGLGQDSLYRVSKAYAVYDSEVGYCQGLSFLAATLLLHVNIQYFLFLGEFYQIDLINLVISDARRASFCSISKIDVSIRIKRLIQRRFRQSLPTTVPIK